MMDNELDKLFRDKLSHRELKASDGAWEKLSGELNNGRKKVIFYWSAAAAIIILLGVSLLFLNNNSGPNQEQLADSEVIQQKANDELTEENVLKEVPETKEKDLSTDKKENQNSIIQKPIRQTGEKKEKTKEPVKPETKDEQLAMEKQLPETVSLKDAQDLQVATVKEVDNQPEIEETVEEELINQTTKNEPLLAENTQSQEQVKSYPEVKIVYKRSNASTSEGDSKSGLKKVIEFAKDIKQGEYGIGELREAKNELLAFGFSKIDDVK